MLEHVVDIPIYRGKLIIIVSDDKEEIKKKISDFEEDGDIYGHACLTNWEGWQGFALVINHKNKHRPLTFGVIAHEALHLTNFLMNERGVHLDYENDEPHAYLLDWIIEQVLDFLSQHKILTCI